MSTPESEGNTTNPAKPEGVVDPQAVEAGIRKVEQAARAASGEAPARPAASERTPARAAAPKRAASRPAPAKRKPAAQPVTAAKPASKPVAPKRPGRPAAAAAKPAAPSSVAESIRRASVRTTAPASSLAARARTVKETVMSTPNEFKQQADKVYGETIEQVEQLRDKGREFSRQFAELGFEYTERAVKQSTDLYLKAAEQVPVPFFKEIAQTQADWTLKATELFVRQGRQLVAR